MFQALVNENNMKKHLRLSMRGWTNWMSEMCLDKRIQDGKSKSFVDLRFGREEETGIGRDWWKCG